MIATSEARSLQENPEVLQITHANRKLPNERVTQK